VSRWLDPLLPPSTAATISINLAGDRKTLMRARSILIASAYAIALLATTKIQTSRIEVITFFCIVSHAFSMHPTLLFLLLIIDAGIYYQPGIRVPGRSISVILLLPGLDYLFVFVRHIDPKGETNARDSRLHSGMAFSQSTAMGSIEYLP